jgi:hypothetical protein
MDNADVYMLLVRPSRVPVLGEAVSMGFQAQVGLKTWKWSFHNDKEVQAAAAAGDAFDEAKRFLSSMPSADARRRHAEEDYHRARRKARHEHRKALRQAGDDDNKRLALEESYEKSDDSLHKSYVEKVESIYGIESAKTARQQRDEEREKSRAAEIEDAERNHNFEFTFTKRVDIATTQMLNSMKAGDVMPSGTITIFQRAAGGMSIGGAASGGLSAAGGPDMNMGMSLVINLQKVRLLDYELKVEVTDTMTDMVESWTAEFGSLAYVYTPRGITHTGGTSKAGTETATKAVGFNPVKSAVQGATQVLPRVFAMKNVGSPF